MEAAWPVSPASAAWLGRVGCLEHGRQSVESSLVTGLVGKQRKILGAGSGRPLVNRI